MRAIVATDLQWGIGYQGNLLQWIPEDMKFFKTTTLGKVVIMGRETFESLPGKEPLKDRINIVLSKKHDFKNDKIIICRSLEALFKELEKYDSDEVFVIGGESVYSQLLPFCKEAYVTKIKKTYVADKYFENLDNNSNWKLIYTSDEKDYKAISFSFLKYENQENL